MLPLAPTTHRHRVSTSRGIGSWLDALPNDRSVHWLEIVIEHTLDLEGTDNEESDDDFDWNGDWDREAQVTDVGRTLGDSQRLQRVTQIDLYLRTLPVDDEQGFATVRTTLRMKRTSLRRSSKPSPGPTDRRCDGCEFTP